MNIRGTLSSHGADSAIKTLARGIAAGAALLGLAALTYAIRWW